MEITQAVHIDAPVEHVFALMADPRARAELNPNIKPLHIDIEGGQPLRQGSICRYRVQTDRQVVDFRSRIDVFEPNRRIVAVIETKVPIQVEILVEEEAGGTLLSHTERFDPNEAMLQTAATEEHNRIMAFVFRVLMWFDLDIAQNMRMQRERKLKQQLEENLSRWLDAIKDHLEQVVMRAESAKELSS